jgi:hypothetical protein
MSAPMAIQATFADFKLIRGRKCAQLVFEVPIEGADAALSSLGGLPRPDQETWFGIARLDLSAKSPKPAQPPLERDGEPIERRKFAELPLSAQAGIVCGEPAFKIFIQESRGSSHHDGHPDPVLFVYDTCKIKSRKELIKGTEAGNRWDMLLSSYMAWRGVLV